METEENIKIEEVASPPDNYLVWAILSTVLCCLPLGIVSIIKSTEVNSKWEKGDVEGAMKSSKAAKKWALWGAIIGGVGGILALIIYFIFFAAAMASGLY